MSKSSGLILFQQAVEELEAKGKQEDIENGSEITEICSISSVVLI